MHRLFIFMSTIMVLVLPAQVYGGQFTSKNKTVLTCNSGHKGYQLDITLFPKTLRVDGTFLELKSSTDANDGFKVGIYQQAFGNSSAMLAVREGYRPVLIEDNKTYVCS